MEGLQVVRSLIQQGDFMMKLDLKDAFYALPIHPSHRKYLRFIYKDRTYEFQCLPFGLSSVPRAFTKTLKPVLAVLQSVDIPGVIYIDDMLLLHQQSKVLQKIFAQVVDLLEKLGFLVKREKCSPIPCQRLIFLGAVLDSTTMTLTLPQPKLTKIVDTCHHLLPQGSGSVRTLSTLIGQMSHVSQTEILVAPLHYRGLQRLHLQAVSHHGHARIDFKYVRSTHGYRTRSAICNDVLTPSCKRNSGLIVREHMSRFKVPWEFCEKSKPPI